MTKVELQEKHNELLKELNKHKNYEKIVLEKDKVIDDLISKHDKRVAEINSKHQEEINDLINKHQQEVNKIVENKTKSLELTMGKMEEESRRIFQKLQQREQQLNRLIDIFGNTLKGMQGQLDNAIELNEYFINEVKS